MKSINGLEPAKVKLEFDLKYTLLFEIMDAHFHTAV